MVAGFSLQLAMGRSTFAAPLRVHVHAVLFMGWVAIMLTQSQLAMRGPLALHRRRSGAVHRAWWFGFATLVGTLALARILAHSPVGDAIYQTTVAGYPGAKLSGLEYGKPPATPLRMGR